MITLLFLPKNNALSVVNEKDVKKMLVNRFSAILGARRIKISDISHETGISRTTLTALYYDKGKAISFDVLDKVCRCLDVQPSDLFSVQKE